MPYASDNTISQRPLEGGIEITQEQYMQALEGMQAGLQLRITQGQIEFVAPPKPEEALEAKPE